MRRKGFILGLAGFAGLTLSGQTNIALGPDTTAHAQGGDANRSYPLACYQMADDRTMLSKDQANRLCIGAVNTAPVDCFVSADRRLMVSDDYNITLCQCARSLEPVDCFERSQNETDISEDRSLQMCNARTLGALGPDCRPR